jgi:hypothetical protein
MGDFLRQMLARYRIINYTVCTYKIDDYVRVRAHPRVVRSSSFLVVNSRRRRRWIFKHHRPRSDPVVVVVAPGGSERRDALYPGPNAVTIRR